MPTLLEKRWPWVLAAVLIVLSVFVQVRDPDEWESRPVGGVAEIEALRERDDVNVLFVLIDTLRADRLSAYGYERPTSPTLDRLAASGLRFERHLAQSSWTKASMASLWTGLYPHRNGVKRFDDVLADEARLPAEILKEAGFRTAAIYRNGWVSPNFGFAQGFDVYTRPIPRPLPPRLKLENPTLSEQGSDEDVLEAAIEFLRIRRGERWFLYLHLMDVHEFLYDEESARFGSSSSDIYDNSILWTDGVIEVLLSYLAAMGELEQTVIVLASDHGEAFNERGYEGHARFVYRESTEVPLVVALPFRLESGVVVRERTRNVDIWPTLLDLLGLEVPEGLDGRSFLPEILAAARGEGSAEPEGPSAVAYLDQNWGKAHLGPKETIAVAEGPYRYVRIDGPEGEPREQLFDADRDAAELVEMGEEEPEVLVRLREAAEAELGKAPPWGEAPRREISEMELNQLRALGYALP